MTFFLLSIYILADGAWTLWSGTRPGKSLPGIVLAAAALVVMPAIGWGKRRVGLKLGSQALVADAAETFLCAYLSFALLLGLTLHSLLGWWWADPAAALLMLPLVINEGREALEEAGEDDEDDEGDDDEPDEARS